MPWWCVFLLETFFLFCEIAKWCNSESWCFINCLNRSFCIFTLFTFQCIFAILSLHSLGGYAESMFCAYFACICNTHSHTPHLHCVTYVPTKNSLHHILEFFLWNCGYHIFFVNQCLSQPPPPLEEPQLPTTGRRWPKMNFLKKWIFIYLSTQRLIKNKYLILIKVKINTKINKNEEKKTSHHIRDW